MCKECGGINFCFIFCSKYIPDPIKEKIIARADLLYTELAEDGSYQKPSGIAHKQAALDFEEKLQKLGLGTSLSPDQIVKIEVK